MASLALPTLRVLLSGYVGQVVAAKMLRLLWIAPRGRKHKSQFRFLESASLEPWLERLAKSAVLHGREGVW
jgi:hypothetical protein